MTAILLHVCLPVSLAIIMLGMGLSLTPNDFTRIFRQPKAVLVGLLNQVVFLPTVGFLLALIFNLDSYLAIGLIILASCPGGPTSNIITQVCKGNIALSVTLTAIASFTCIATTNFVTSFALSFFGSKTNMAIELPMLDTVWKITLITIFPICIGMLIRKLKTTFAIRMEKPMRVASTLIFTLIFAGIVATNFNQIGSAIQRVGLVTLLLNLSTIALGYFIAKLFNLGYANAIAIAVDGGIQNATLSLVITTTILNNIEMAVPTAAYTIWMYLTGSILMWKLSKNANPQSVPQ